MPHACSCEVYRQVSALFGTLAVLQLFLRVKQYRPYFIATDHSQPCQPLKGDHMVPAHFVAATAAPRPSVVTLTGPASLL